MKTTTYFSWIILVFACATLGAQGRLAGNQMHVRYEAAYPINPFKLSIWVNNMEGRRTLISVQNLDGDRVFSEYITNHDGYAKTLDFQGLSDGTYVLWVDNGVQVKTRMLTLLSDGLFPYQNADVLSKATALRVSEANQVLPEVLCTLRESGEGQLQLVVANLLNRTVNISLHSPDEGVLFESFIQDQTGYAKAFDLKGISASAGYLFIQFSDKKVVQFFRIHNDKLMLLDRQESHVNNQSIQIVGSTNK